MFQYDISHPGKNSASTIHPNNKDLLPCVRKSCSFTEIAIDHVITKTFRHYDIPFQITDNIISILQLNYDEWGKHFLRKMKPGKHSSLIPGKREWIPLGT